MSSPVAEGLLTLEAVEKLSLAKHEPDWMLAKRREAWTLFESLPTPDWTRGIRGWWHSAVKQLDINTLQPYTPAGNALPELDSFNVAEEGDEVEMVTEVLAGIIVQYNSEVVRIELSVEATAAGVIFTSLDEAVQKHPELVQQYFMSSNVKAEENKFTALHAALWSGGAFLYVPDKVEITAPFRIVFYTDVPQAALFSHVVVVTGAGSKAKVIEEQLSNDEVGGQIMDANIVETFVGKDSTLEFYNPQEWGTNVNNFSTKRALLSNNSLNRWIVALFGSDETRLDLESITQGEGARAETIGAIFPTGDQHHDLKTTTRHSVPHTNGDALFKAALRDRGQYGFQGKIRVDKNGKFTKSVLGDHVLFLSEESKADALPSLDVDANDVQCAHGQTIGMVDDNQIFYLQTRGLSRDEAISTIVSGFFEQVTDRVPLASVRERLRRSLARKMA